MTYTDWTGCYDGGWKGLIVPEAFAHPAKFSYALIQRIMAHGLEQGYWRPGDTIGDPFGGVALGGISAGYAGLNWIGVELEPRFVKLGNENLALHRGNWCVLAAENGLRQCVQLVQGDSRNFAALVGECGAVVTSPPWQENLSLDRPNAAERRQVARERGISNAEHVSPIEMEKLGKRHEGDYGTSPGQIGQLPAGSLDAVITSPPYAETGSGGNMYSGEVDTTAWSDGRPRKMGPSMMHGDGYGQTEGQIGSLPVGDLAAVVTSPPYAKSMDSIEDADSRKERTNGFECGQKDLRYGQNPNTFLSTDPSGLNNDERREVADKNPQIGQLREETYWQAVAQVYAQCRLALRPGGIMALVVKDYVKNKARVPLCDQTCELLARLGFEVFERTRCWLTKETTHEDLFAGTVTKKKERKSFFRRLAEKKGSPRIDWEEVIWCRNQP